MIYAVQMDLLSASYPKTKLSTKERIFNEKMAWPFIYNSRKNFPHMKEDWCGACIFTFFHHDKKLEKKKGCLKEKGEKTEGLFLFIYI